MGDLFDMTGKTVLITGGSRGLGRAMAQGFAEAGADIAVSSRKIENCEEVAAAIAYLASPLAGAVTGTALAVDGGMSGLRLRPRTS